MELFDMLGHASIMARVSLLVTLFPLAAGVAYLVRPTEQRLALMRPISLVGIFSGILILEALERGVISRPTRVLYAIVGGLIMAEMTVVLNWWPTHGWTGGAVLLVCFYLISGIMVARAQRSVLTGRDFIEYGLVGGAALFLLAITA